MALCRWWWVSQGQPAFAKCFQELLVGGRYLQDAGCGPAMVPCTHFEIPSEDFFWPGKVRGFEKGLVGGGWRQTSPPKKATKKKSPEMFTPSPKGA